MNLFQLYKQPVGNVIFKKKQVGLYNKKNIDPWQLANMTNIFRYPCTAQLEVNELFYYIIVLSTIYLYLITYAYIHKQYIHYYHVPICSVYIERMYLQNSISRQHVRIECHSESSQRKNSNPKVFSVKYAACIRMFAQCKLSDVKWETANEESRRE